MATITIAQYMALPEGERPEVRFRNDIVESIYPDERNEGCYVIAKGPFRNGRLEPNTILQIWESGDVREKLIGVQSELASTYFDVRHEYERSRREPQNDWEQKYWQGKKDGMRICLAALNELMPDGYDWEGLQESSNKGRGTQLRVIKAQIKEAVRILEDIKESGKYDKRDMESFFRWIEHAKKEYGIVYEDRE